MFRALMGGSRPSSDVRSSTSSSKSGRRRTDSKASSTTSRKSSRGDDRDRGLGDLSTYPTAGGRNKRYAASAAGESVASSYATADPGVLDEPDRVIIERRPGRWDADDGDGSRDRDLDDGGDGYRDRNSGDRDRQQSARRRDRVRSPSPDRERTRRAGTDDRWEADDRASARRERQRTHPDVTLPPISTTIPTTGAGGASPSNPTAFDPHVQQQFPGQFPALHTEPYRPPNPAGEAADYYGDQGQSVADQPGIRPAAPDVLPNNQAHLMPASPAVNPPPEPSSVGGVGAAAAYYSDAADGGAPAMQPSGQPPLASPPDTLHSSHPSIQSTGAATYGVGDVDSPMFPPPSSATSFAPPMASHHASKPSHSHGGTGAAVGMAAAAAGAGYMIGHHNHHHSSSSHSSPPYPTQPGASGPTPHDAYASPSMYPPNMNLALYGTGAVGYAAHPSHPHHAALYHGPSFQSGAMAFHQPRRGPLDRFVDFWRDPHGVGQFEDYTESIGVCKYCFEPGSTSRDAPRKHNYQPRRHSGDRRSGHSRVEKLSRYTSSEDEGRHRKRSSRNSWIPGLLGGYAIKSLFNTKDFEDTYSVRSGRATSSHGSEGGSVSGRKSDTSRGVYRRRSHDRLDRSSYSDVGKGRYAEPRRGSRSRSRSSSRPHRHSALRDAALGAAVGTAAGSVIRSRQRSHSRSRSRSPRKSKGQKSSSSDSSFVDIGHPSRKSTGGAFGSFFTASSENRKKRPTAKKPRSLFSFNNSSSSSTDADLAFGSGYAKKPPGMRKKRGKKQDRDDVDAKLLGLGAAATALAASPHGRSRRPGEVLLGKESRTSRSDYASSATNDDGWEDLDSSDQSSSSVSSALAFGGHSALFSSDDSSDSGTSKWGWRWGSKKDKKGKKEKKKRKGKKRSGSSSSDDRFPTGAAALGVGALGTAALAATAASRRHASQDSTGSLQYVAPVPTSDPSRYDTVRIPSSQPAFVRPGPIPLQQPQPVTPVSQAVYTSQGESIHAYTAPTAGPPPFKTPFDNYTSRPRDRNPRYRDWDQPTSAYDDRGEAPGRIDGLHRRSNTFPTSPTEPLEGSAVSSLRRRATAKDQASVSFNLTEEQERRADRRERQNRSSDFDGRVQLIDNERESTRPEDDRWSKWRRGDDDHDRRAWAEDDKQRQWDSRGSKSSSWIGAAAVSTIGAAAAASALSGRGSNGDASEASSQRRHDERREKRRAERRRGSEPESVTASYSVSPSSSRDSRYYPSYSPWSPEPEPVKRTTRRDVSPTKPKHEDYAEFFAPKEVRRRSDDSSRESRVMPTIVEVVPASERPEGPIEPDPEFLSRVPWTVPDITYTKPTPPQSVSGSVRDAASPAPRPQRVAREEESPERPVTFSRVSWGDHETHEYEVPSSDSEHDSVDQDYSRHRERRGRKPKEDSGKGIGEDIAFAATVAAATAAAGFDPSLVTDDPKYHTRSSPPHGRFSRAIEQEEDESHGGEKLSRARDVAANGAPGVQRNVGSRDKPESPTDVALHMPGGFEEPVRQADSREASIDDPRSVVSAPAPGELAERVPKDLQRRISGDTEEGEDTGSPSVEPGDADGKKKRRKKHSKRRSDGLDDSASVASSPAKIGDDREKRRGTKEKSRDEKSGNFFSNIFGSKVSEPVESKRPSSSSDRRETKSEIGSRTPEESRHRRQERSSRHRSSNRDEKHNDDDSTGEDDMVADKENINVESYKSSRQRREERRRQRYEWDNKTEESEKDRELSRDHADEERSFLAEVSPETAGVTRLGLDVVDSAPESPSRPSSPKVIERQTKDVDENDGPLSRRSSIVRSTESPTAVPLHFRRPPTSPATQRSPSEGSAAVQPPESPTQSRPRRPNSSEFVFSREIRPLWLVERHGATNPELQDEDEPLPSLPSSKTTSASASVEDLTALPDEKRWETTDLSHHIYGDRPRELDLSSAQEYHEILDSQQGTPTAGNFHPSHSRPSSLRKEGSKPKYEFHSPSELLQDPTGFVALPPSPTLGALPSVVGSAVGGKDDEWDLDNLPALPLSRPTTPESKTMDSLFSDTDTTPTQKRVVAEKSIPEHSGHPSALEAAIAAAAGVGGGDLAANKEIPVESTERTQIEQTLVPRDGVPETADVKRPATPTQLHSTTDERSTAALASERSTADEHTIDVMKRDTENVEAQTQPQQEDTAPETPTSSSSKKKKKKDRKKKNKSMDSSSIQEPEIVSEPSASKPALPEQESALGDSGVMRPESEESSKALDVESMQATEREPAVLDAVGAADSEKKESSKDSVVDTAQLPKQDSATSDVPDGAIPEVEESTKALSIETTQDSKQESTVPDVLSFADIEKDVHPEPIQSATLEDSVPEDTTSKKSKRDKKKNKKKGKNSTTEAAAEESPATEPGSAQPAVDTPVEEKPALSIEEMNESTTQEGALPVEEPAGTTEDKRGESKDLSLPDCESTSAGFAVSAHETADVRESTRDVSLPESSNAHPSLDTETDVQPTQNVSLPETSDAQSLGTGREPEPTTSTQEEVKPTDDHPGPVLAESTPDAENTKGQDPLCKIEEQQQDPGESMQEVHDTNEKPVSLEQQEQSLETPVQESSVSTDQKDTVAETESQKDDGAAKLGSESPLEAPVQEPSSSLDQKDMIAGSEPQKEAEAAELEPETPLSRKSSKKKKKNKRKSAAEPETEPAETTSQREAPAEADEPPVTDEQTTEAKQLDDVRTEQQQEVTQEAQDEDVVDTTGEAEIAPSTESKEEPTLEEGAGDQSSKKSKKKNKKKNKSISLTESQPETAPEQAESGAQTSGELPPPAPAPAADVVVSPPQPEENSIANEESTKETQNDAVEGTLDNKPDTSSVESPEANDGPPHVLDSPAGESVPEPDAGGSTPAGKKGKKNKKKKQQSVSAPNDSSTALGPDTADASADVPAAVEQPSSPTQAQEPEQEDTVRDISAAAVEPSQASIGDQPPVDLSASSEESPVTAEPEPESEQKSPEGELPADNSSATEDPPISSEPAPEQGKPTENEPSVGPSEAPQDPAVSEPAPPMTAAQKKKAKKDNKKKNKKQQQQVAESVDETPVSSPAVEEPKTVEETVTEAAVAIEPADESPEQPRDVGLEDATPIVEGELAKDAGLDTAPAHVEEPAKEAEVLTESADKESPEQPKDVDLDTITIAADEPAKETDGEQNEPAGVTEETSGVVSEEATSADIEPTQKEEVDATKPADEQTKSGDAPEASAEAPPAEAFGIAAEEESAKADTEGATEKSVEDRQEQTPVEADPTAGTEQINDDDEKAVTEAGSKDQVEESQPAPSSKSKKKNKKKKRQSVALEEEPSTPVAESETIADPPSEIPPDTPQTPEQPEQPQEEQKTLAGTEDTENTENVVSEEVPQEPQTDQDQAPESKEEPQSTISKKKAKKDRKKRKSVSFAADDTPEQTSEPAETQAVAGTEDTPLSETPKDEPAIQPSEEPQVTVPTTEDPVEEVTSVAPEQSETSTSAEATGTPAEVASEVPTESTGPVDQMSTEDEPATETPPHEDNSLSREAEPSEVAQDNAPVDTPKVGDQTLTEDPSAEPATQELTEAPSPTATDEAPEPVSSESRKDKKKKKKKNKRNVVETTEDAPEAVPEDDVTSESKEERSDAPAADEADSGATVSEVKVPEEDSLLTEANPEAEEQSKEPVPEENVQEPGNLTSEYIDSAPATLDAAVEEKKPEEIIQLPKTPEGEGEAVAMSAKEKRKAKKKRRKSKGLDTTDESPTADAPSQGLSEEPSETAPAPEDDGKDNQSHGTDIHATNDENVTWTDKVSSQVEQQQEVTSPQSPFQLVPEKNDSVPSGEEHRLLQPEDVDKGEDQVTGVGELELEEKVSRDLDVQEGDRKVADARSEAVIEEAAGGKQDKEQENDEAPSMEALPTDTDKVDVSAVDVSAKQEAERLKETTAAPAIEHAVETALPREQPSASSDLAADEQEAPETTTFSKKMSKKEKKRQRQAQKSLQATKSIEETSPVEEATAPDSADGQEEAVPEASQDVNVLPEESILPKEIESPQVPEAVSLIPTENKGKDIESVLPAESELKEHELVPEAKSTTATEEAQETTVDETVLSEPAKEISQIPESQGPPAATEPDKNHGPVEDISTEPSRETAEPILEGKEISRSDVEVIASDPSIEVNAEETEPVKEEPAPETLSRKESKKKKKKAKKQGKEQPEQPSPSTSDEKEGSAAADLPVDSAEQAQRREPADVVDFSKAPPDAEGPEVNKSMGPQEMSQDETERELSRGEESRQIESGNAPEEVEPAATAEKKEEDDPEAAANPTEQLETAAPITRKLSKKEKRRAKQKAKQEIREPEPEQEQEEAPAPVPVPEPEPEAHPAASAEEHPLVAETSPEPSADEPSVSRTLPTKEKKRNERRAEEPEKTLSLKTEVEPAQSEQAWPAIDIGWDKSRDNSDKVENPPEHTLRRQPSKVASIFPELERGMFRRPSPPQRSESVKDGAEDESETKAIQISEAPTTTTTARDGESTQLGRPSSALERERSVGASRSIDVSDAKAPHKAPLQAPVPTNERPSTPVHSTADITKQDRPSRTRSLEEDSSLQQPRTPPPRPSIFGGPPGDVISPPRTPLRSIRERETTPEGRVEKPDGPRPTDQEGGTSRLEMRSEHVLPRPETPTRKFTDNAMARQQWPTPDKDRQSPLSAKGETRQPSRVGSPSPWRVGTRTPELQDTPILRPSSSTRSLRRTMRSTSGDLRATSQAQEEGDAKGKGKEKEEARAQSRDPPQPPELKSASDLNLERIPSSSTYDPITDKGKRPLRNMADVYEGWGQTPSSPRSPNRPPSVRHRRSMQHLQELESRIDQLISDNRILLAAREAAEDKLRRTSVARRRSDNALNRSDADLRDRSAEVEQLRTSVDWLQKEVARLTEEKDGLVAANTNLTQSHAQELQTLQESSTRELGDLRSQHDQLTTTVQDRVRQEVETALSQKNQELRRLRQELESARDKVQELQQQIAASMNDGVLVFRDEDYFDAACQKLCGHVQQWVLRFSKHSDHRRCRKLGDLQDEKVADRFDNAVLDGFDTDTYLTDRVRRRDVFMSVVMTMVWEFIFTRYLFGMDREQRQKLKSLEKQLAEIGPRSAVHRWRATTLTLLAKRPAFSRQRESDTEAVALEIFETLSRILPPPTHVEAQLLESLRKVLRVAAALSIEMRTQLAEYIMLPPLQPEYDTNGDLTRQVSFNASLMNERSGETTSNEELESQQAVVRVVLFPLVVKKGNDLGEGEDEVVVCPAQVLIARPEKDKRVVKMLSGDRMSVDTRSVHSIAPSSMMDMTGSNVI